MGRNLGEGDHDGGGGSDGEGGGGDGGGGERDYPMILARVSTELSRGVGW